MAAATATLDERASAEPLRTICNKCAQPVLVVTVPAIPDKHMAEKIVVAEPWEWQPRSRCFVCANNAARTGKPCGDCEGSGYVGGAKFLRLNATDSGGESEHCLTCDGLGSLGAPKRDGCSRCGGDGYVGSTRPQTTMLGIDMAWGDEIHVRLIGARTDRRRGEGLHELHACEVASRG